MAPSTSRKRDLPVSCEGIPSRFRYQPTPALGRRPMPPPPWVVKGPSIAQSWGKLTWRHELSSKAGAAYGTASPGSPLGLTNLREVSFMNSLPVGRIQGLIRVGTAVTACASAPALLACGLES